MERVDLPAIYTAADDASAEAQVNFNRALAANLTLLVLAGALSLLDKGSLVTSALQLICLLSVLGTSIFLATSKLQESWYGKRALAESVKTVSWRYVMRAEPFDTTEEKSRRDFLETLRKIVSSNAKISGKISAQTPGSQITERMVSIRAMSIADRKVIYLRDRIGDQEGWYLQKAAFNRGRSKLLFIILILVNVFAILSAIGAIWRPTFTYWPTETFAAAGGAILAWMQAKRHQELSASYALTAHEIAILREEIPNNNSQTAFSKFVGDAENAFSREHTQWQARKDV